MRCLRSTASLLILWISAFVVPSSYGAAQLKTGAKTSAQPTSTIPAQRAIQITFDPGPDSVAPPDQGYDVDAFQLTVSYDPTLMTVADVELIPPFQPAAQIGLASSASPSATPAAGYVNDPVGGTISYISGTASSNTAAGPGDVNIFYVDFILDPGVSFDQALNFSIYADDTNGDFISGYDPTINSSLTFQAAGITSASLDTTFDEAPEPSCLALGAVGLATLLRRKR